MSLRRALTVLTLFIALGFTGADLRAAPAADAAGFINDLVNKGLEALGNTQLTQADREKQFRALLLDDFDMQRISRFVLGRYWNEASDQDKQNFEHLFRDYVVHAYSSRFSQYSGQQVKVTGQRPESETTTIVMSQIIQPNGAPPAKVDWRVRKGDGGYKIVDVDVEGVSMLITQREEFGTVIQRNGGTVAGLNQALQQKLASGDTALAAPMLPKHE
ncbi:MAG TPA: ABC transporter substrate-binding protein [Stellaceae bacterium]|nr:ABC transporter substrate-binding protein [Stellaceae bacterium]